MLAHRPRGWTKGFSFFSRQWGVSHRVSDPRRDRVLNWTRARARKRTRMREKKLSFHTTQHMSLVTPLRSRQTLGKIPIQHKKNSVYVNSWVLFFFLIVEETQPHTTVTQSVLCLTAVRKQYSNSARCANATASAESLLGETFTRAKAVKLVS